MQPNGSGGRPDRHPRTMALGTSAATSLRKDAARGARREMVRAFQWDIARQIERLDVLKRLLPRYATWGYHELYLHLESAVHYPSLPGIGRKDAYSYQQLGGLVRAATRAGIGVVPIVNLLGHTQYLIEHPELRDLNELRDERGAPLAKGQICPLHPRTLEVAEKLLRDMKPFCTTGKVHVGLDESFHLGKCPRCRAEVEKIGLAAHFAGHVQRLHALCAKLGLELGMWADMLYFVPEAIPLLPRGITAYEWYYYPFAKLPRVELFNFAERDLATPLKKQGIRYYGCPMNGAFRYEPMPVFGDRLDNIKSWWRRCHEVQADGFLITSWEPYRLAFETTTAVDAGAANLWLQPVADDNVSLLTSGLERALGARSARSIARNLLQADEFAFAGYARWQINDRWDTFAGTEGVAKYEGERAFFRRLAARAVREAWPEPIRASIGFRLYLAERDVFVRRAARRVFALRRLRSCAKLGEARTLLAQMRQEARAFYNALRDGLRAAHSMHRLTRRRAGEFQNGHTICGDESRLKQWQEWLSATIKSPANATQACVVAGRWQVRCWVYNFAPAVQRVSIEQQSADGHWRELAARHTIEFRAHAAKRRSMQKREFSAPVEDTGAPLRVCVGGFGQVQLAQLSLTDGVTTHRARAGFRGKKTLGRPAPTRGFPDHPASTGEVEWRIVWD